MFNILKEVRECTKSIIKECVEYRFERNKKTLNNEEQGCLGSSVG